MGCWCAAQHTSRGGLTPPAAVQCLDAESFIICTTPRSGSTLLCGVMASTGVFGRPDSYFHNTTRAGWLADHGLSLADFTSPEHAVSAGIKAVVFAGRKKSEIFGLRLQGAYLPFMLAQLAVLYPDTATDRDRIDAAFGQAHYIHLTRDDRLAQAISRHLARDRDAIRPVASRGGRQ